MYPTARIAKNPWFVEHESKTIVAFSGVVMPEITPCTCDCHSDSPLQVDDNGVGPLDCRCSCINRSTPFPGLGFTDYWKGRPGVNPSTKTTKTTKKLADTNPYEKSRTFFVRERIPCPGTRDDIKFMLSSNMDNTDIDGNWYPAELVHHVGLEIQNGDEVEIIVRVKSRVVIERKKTL